MDKWLDEVGLDEVRLNKASLDKARLDEDRINLSKILLRWFLIEAIEILLRFQCLLNLGKILDKIWAEVMALTVRNCTRIDIRFRSNEV